MENVIFGFFRSVAPAPVFEMTMYTVPEDDASSVPLCVDIGVEITEPITYTITTAQKTPPQAEGRNKVQSHSLLILSQIQISLMELQSQ